MARPTKLGLEYFPLDVDIFDDEKVLPVSTEYGFKGELILIRVLCAIYRNGYFAERSDSLIYKLAKQTGVNHSLVSDVISGLVRWGFFDKTVFDSAGVLTSRGIQKRWKEAVRKRVVDVANLPYWIVEGNGKNEFPAPETKVSGGRNATNQEFPAEEIRQKKRKEIKGEKESIKKNYRFLPPSLEDIENYFSEKIKENNLSMNSKNEAVKFESFYSSKNWFVGKNKMADWKKAVDGWIARSKTFEQQKSITYSKPDFSNKFK